MNEGQLQILSKGDLKKYKQDKEERLDAESDELEDGPEEVSVLLQRGSRVVKDFDVLRFSKASSMDQNFVAEVDSDSRLGMYQIGPNGGNRGGRDGSGERGAAMVEQRSPLAINKRRTSGLHSGAKNSALRKLTNSLFEEGVFPDKHNVIKEEDKERDE